MLLYFIGNTNLQLIERIAAVKLIHKVLPHPNSDTLSTNSLGYPADDWLHFVWSYLCDEYSKNLSPFEDLHLIPSTSGQQLYRLKGNVALIEQLQDNDLNEAVMALGIVSLTVPHFIKRHELCNNYIEPPSAVGLMRALEKRFASSQRISEEMTECLMGTKEIVRRKLVEFLSMDGNHCYKHRHILMHLPVYERVDSTFGCIEAGMFREPYNFRLPIPCPRFLLKDDNQHYKLVLDAFGISKITIGKLLTWILPKASDKLDYCMYKSLIIHTLENMKEYIQGAPELYMVVSELKVTHTITHTHKMVCAKDLLDPSDNKLFALFHGLDVFPASEFCEPVILNNLKELGIRNSKSVTACDLLKVLEYLSVQGNLAHSKLEERAEQLVLFLGEHRHILTESTSKGIFLSVLQDVHWVPVLLERPNIYPSSLQWYHGKYLQKPANVYSLDQALVIGSINPVSKLQLSLFLRIKSPPLDSVIEHLKHVIEGHTVTMSNDGQHSEYMYIIKDIYDFMMKCNIFQIVNTLKRYDIENWIWQGDGFSSVRHIVMSKPFTDMRPFIFDLPSGMHKYAKMFSACGMKSECDVIDVLSQIQAKYIAVDGKDEAELTHDLQLCVQILLHLEAKEDILFEDLQNRILFPLYSTPPVKRLTFAKSDECAYAENDYHFQVVSDVLLLHPVVPIKTAKFFKLRSLTSQILDVEDVDMSFGQCEPLTRRLKNLLLDYTDGFAVAKELIQNADDAGATEVCILYDERENNDARNTLIDPGMSKCHGPALWVYNNAVFTDADFENIVKLSGATKKDKLQKIGRFGLGFNAVYNLTDVPSFISRNNIVFFDPHTHHLGNVIRDKLKPGIKINVGKQFKQMALWRDQFKPYEGVFGFKMPKENDTNLGYNGTLFRLPLRTKEQASKSEISQLHYSANEVKTLLEMIVNGSSDLLLFTQNVLRVKIYSLPSDANKPEASSIKLFTLHKQLVKLCKQMPNKVTLSEAAKQLPLATQDFIRQCNILQVSSALVKNETPEPITVSMVVKMKCSITESGKGFFNGKSTSQTHLWLQCLYSCCDAAFDVARNDKTLVPVAGVAASLSSSNGSFHPNKNIQGKVFCFMPLPITSNLPVHVNGYFAVTSSRQHLRTTTVDDKDQMPGNWNQLLTCEGVCRAYLILLEELTFLVHPEEVDPFSLWPVEKALNPILANLLKSLYSCLSDDSRESKALFSNGHKWIKLHDCRFLDSKLVLSKVWSSVLGICKNYHQEASVIDIPKDILSNFEFAGCLQKIIHLTFTIVQFYELIFFPNIERIPSDERDVVLLFAMENENVHKLIKSNQCIPVKNSHPNVKKNSLKKPCDLIHPDGEIAALYRESDNRFPISIFLQPSYSPLLESFGMQKNDLEWDDLMERAVSVEREEFKLRKERIPALIKFIDRKASNNKKDTKQKNKFHFDEIAFIYAKLKPNDFPITWKGCQFPKDHLHRPSTMYLSEAKYLVGSSELIVDEQVLSARQTNAVKLLGVKDKSQVTADAVFEQILNIKKISPSSLSPIAFGELSKCFDQIYHFIKNQMEKQKNVEHLVHELVIFQDGYFIQPEKACFCVNSTVSPYLWSIYTHLEFQFRKVFKAAGVKDKFNALDYISAIKELQQNNLDKELCERDVNKTIDLLTKAANCTDDRLDSKVPVYMPDTLNRLQLASDICFSNCPWFSAIDNDMHCHQKISFDIARKFGVKTVRENDLEKHAIGIAFGQYEPLSNRIKRILEAYPCDKEILNELLQNADDAKATEIHFVIDPQHHGTEKVFEDSWKPVQGPALCVYNNKPFTQRDLEGIQKLGEGSKAADSTKIGQYGIGFNCVYHLTDVPCILTSTDGVENLIVFDPNCSYMPGASENEPGRRLIDLDNCREKYQDVFKCFIEEHFDTKHGTLFRFPLRTKAMAKSSKICDHEFRREYLDDLVHRFISGAKSALLFLQNIEKITISTLDKSGKLVEMFSVHTDMSNVDREKRQDFINGIKNVKTDNHQSLHYPLSQSINVVYEMKVSCQDELSEHWLISQQFGPTDCSSVPENISESFRDKQMRLLPYGGTAALLDMKRDQKTSIVPVKGKAYCFLPLPVETHLPVHVNGHFALDHESRRDLWKGDGSSNKKSWNNFLLEKVIAPSYVLLLLTYRDRIGEFYSPSLPVTILNTHVERYFGIFPNIERVHDYWKYLATCVFKHMSSGKHNFLPVVHQIQGRKHGNIQWVSPSLDNAAGVYFPCPVQDNAYSSIFAAYSKRIEQKMNNPMLLQNLLIKTGLMFVNAPNHICESFKVACIEFSYLNPQNVFDFFKKHRESHSICTIHHLPQQIENTTLGNVDNIKLILDFIKQVISTNDVEGLPFLLTASNTLNVLSPVTPVFGSELHSVFPKSASQFLHDELLIYFKTKETNIIKELCVSDIAEMLQAELPHEYCGNKKWIQWHPETKSLPNGHWLTQLWACICQSVGYKIKISYSKKKETSTDYTEEMKPLERFCLLPAKSCKSRIVVALDQCVIDYQCEYLNRDIFELLKLIGLPVMDTTQLHTCSTETFYFIQSFTTSVHHPDRIVKALKGFEKPCQNLKHTHISTLLLYFCKHIEKIKEVTESKEILRRLPIYITLDKQCISLENICFRVPNEIPSDGVDIWRKYHQITFLINIEKFHSIMQFLGCEELSIIPVYCRFICDRFAEMSEAARMKHISFLRDKFRFWNTWTEQQELQVLIDKLMTCAFIPANNGLHTANTFYDDNVEIFRVMGEPFPEAPFNAPDWKEFLIRVGLITEVSDNKYIEYAETISADAKIKRSESTARKSLALVKHILEHKPSQCVLKKIRVIKFIEAKLIPKDLESICKQYGHHDGKPIDYICFQDSVPEKLQDIVWSKAHILPAWADPFEETHLSDRNLADELGIQSTPSVRLVAEHCKHICSTLSPKRHLSIINDDIASRLKITMTNIYDYLQKKALNSSVVRDILGDTCCAFVKDFKIVITPKQMVKKINDEDEILHYLHGIPDQIIKFIDLFNYLGMGNKVTLNQYADVFKMIWEDSQGKTLHPNELENTKQALEGFCDLLDKQEVDISVTDLFLPGYAGKNDIRLMKTSSLVFLDEQRWSKRLHAFQMHTFANINKLGHHKLTQVLSKLPECIKMNMVSQIVKERLSETNIEIDQESPFVVLLKEKFSSKLISDYIIRLIKHHYASINPKKKLDEIEDGIKRFEMLFSTTEIISLANCVTYLESNGITIPDSQSKSNIFQLKQENSLIVYIKNHISQVKEPLISERIKSFIQKVIFQTIGIHVDILGVLTWNSKYIGLFLDEMGIPQDDELKYESILPDCGSFIPIENHHLLNNDFTDFFLGEFVGYEIDDPILTNENEEPTYIYARITAVLHTSCTSMFSKMYKIKIDEDSTTRDVHCTDLYKFIRIEQLIECNAIALSTQVNRQGQTQSDSNDNGDNKKRHNQPATKSLSEVKDEISDMLEEAWKLPKAERAKIIKRLYLKWHPDKNYENEQFCTEVFKFLQNEIKRLEEGRPRTKHDGSQKDSRGASRGDFYGSSAGSSSYDDFFDFMNARARSHRGHSARYRENFNSEFRRSNSHYNRRRHNNVPPSFTRKNPQPGESRRWMTQARADIQAGQADIERNNEWACLKFYQVLSINFCNTYHTHFGAI